MDLTCSFDVAMKERGWPQQRSWTAWLVPDVALLVSFLTLFFVLFLFHGTHQLFRDSDSGWHIRTGEAMLLGAGLPRTDPYSLLRFGQPWFAWEWASDMLMGAAHGLDGMTGVALLYGTVIAACTWLWFRLHWIVGGNFLLACMLAAPMLSTTNLHWLARPHIFSWGLLLIAIVWAERHGERDDPRFTMATALAVFAFAALWANMHASFFLAPAVAAVYAVAHWLRPRIWRADVLGVSAAAEHLRAVFFGFASLTALAGTFINPYGWQLHRHVIRYLGDAELIDRIGEFQSFNFHAQGSFQIMLTVAIAALGGVLALGQKKLAHFLLAAAFIGMALRSARGLPVLALAILPLANGAITRALADAGGLRPRVRNAIQSFLEYSRNLRRLDSGLGGLALVPVLVFIAFAVLHTPSIAAATGFSSDEFPVAAAERVARLPENARLLAPDKFGGYLIYRFNGTRKVFFDGRSDFYGSQYMKDYLHLVEVRPGWPEQLESIGFTHALLPNQYSLIPALEQLGWARIYSDNVATLLEKRK